MSFKVFKFLEYMIFSGFKSLKFISQLPMHYFLFVQYLYSGSYFIKNLACLILSEMFHF